MKDDPFLQNNKDINKHHKHKLKASAVTSKKVDIRWVLLLTFTSCGLSILLTYLSSISLGSVSYFLAFMILVLFIAVGVGFDIVGIAAASATEAPFHSMASRKVTGSMEALILIRRADKVSCFCNDVVGDISGIISGTTSAVIVTRLASDLSLNNIALQLVFSGIVAGLTVGGKAAGKSLALNRNTQIIYMCGRVLHLFRRMNPRRRK